MISEKWLLDNLAGIDVSGELISRKGKEEYHWGYGAGEGNDYRRVTFRNEADSIHITDLSDFGSHVFSIDLPRYARNKSKNIEAQELIRKWEEEVLK